MNSNIPLTDSEATQDPRGDSIFSVSVELNRVVDAILRHAVFTESWDPLSDDLAEDVLNEILPGRPRGRGHDPMLWALAKAHIAELIAKTREATQTLTFSALRDSIARQLAAIGLE